MGLAPGTPKTGLSAAGAKSAVEAKYERETAAQSVWLASPEGIQATQDTLDRINYQRRGMGLPPLTDLPSNEE